MYNASGHGAWEASLTNLLSPGDTILVLETGYLLRAMGRNGHRPRADRPHRGRRPAHGCRSGRNCGTALAADTAGEIKAVCAVHNETATGMMLPIDEIRAIIDAHRHQALFLVDTISSLGSLDFRMDEWKIDCVVGGSQKGPDAADRHELHRRVRQGDGGARARGLRRHYFDWTMMAKRPQKSFIGTLPVNMFYGLRESVRLLEDEGLDNVVARHTRLAEATRRAVKVWAGNNGPQCIASIRPVFRFRDRHPDAGGPRRRGGAQHRAQSVQRFSRRRAWARWGQGIPDRPSRRSERADAAGRADGGRNGVADQQRPAWQGRRGRGDGLFWRPDRSEVRGRRPVWRKQHVGTL